jgi:hypothetical protein
LGQFSAAELEQALDEAITAADLSAFAGQLAAIEASRTAE